MDLQRQVKLLTQKEAAFSKQQKALEAQVSRALSNLKTLPFEQLTATGSMTNIAFMTVGAARSNSQEVWLSAG